MYIFPSRTFLLVLLVMDYPLVSEAQMVGQPGGASSFRRKYIVGDTYRYILITDEGNNGKWESTTIVECELRVVKDSATIPYDEVRWLSKKTLTIKDTIYKTDEALRVKPYQISLDPAGRLDIPKIKVPGMTGVFNDFNTFFVAISPQLGTMNLIKQGDSLVKKEPVKGNFSNGRSILIGEDCLAINVKIIEETKDRVMVQTSFLPPSQPSLDYLTDDMKNEIVKDTMVIGYEKSYPNNYLNRFCRTSIHPRCPYSGHES